MRIETLFEITGRLFDDVAATTRYEARETMRRSLSSIDVSSRARLTCWNELQASVEDSSLHSAPPIV